MAKNPLETENLRPFWPRHDYLGVVFSSVKGLCLERGRSNRKLGTSKNKPWESPRDGGARSPHSRGWGNMKCRFLVFGNKKWGHRRSDLISRIWHTIPEKPKTQMIRKYLSSSMFLGILDFWVLERILEIHVVEESNLHFFLKSNFKICWIIVCVWAVVLSCNSVLVSSFRSMNWIPLILV